MSENPATLPATTETENEQAKTAALADATTADLRQPLSERDMAKGEKLRDDASLSAATPEPAVGATPASDATSAEQAEPSEPEVPAVTEAPLPAWTARLPLILSVAFPTLLFFFLPPLSRSGLWDPFEVNVAELSRRIAINTMGAEHLILNSSDNSMPGLDDLGRPQAAFTAIALGFKWFGLHEWAGRVPLALLGVIGVVATYAFVAKLFDRKTGLYSAVVLSTMPLYFAQARMMLGDIATMAALAISFGGLAVFMFYRDEKGAVPSLAKRAPWLVAAILGLLLGYESRGALLGVAVPCLGVGVAWALSFAAATWKSGDRDGDVVGAVALAAGALVLFFAFDELNSDSTSKKVSMVLGTIIAKPAHTPSFDFYIAAIGHALAPWSAFIPFAFGRMFLRPVALEKPQEEREANGRAAILLGATFAFSAHTLLAPHSELMAFCGPALLAAACGIAIRDLELGAAPSTLVGLGTVMLLAVLHHDFHEIPEKAYQALAIAGAPFPDGFKNTALALWWVSLGLFAVVVFLTWAEKGGNRKAFATKSYVTIFESLRDVYDGLLGQLFLMIVATFAVLAVVVLAAMRGYLPWFPSVSMQAREILINAWWIVALAPLGVIFGIQFVCDLWLWTFSESHRFSGATFTRGFEPFEELFERFKSKDAAERNVAWFVLAPLMLLATPAVVFVGLHATVLPNMGIAAVVAIPTGVALFLLLGIVGDLLRHRATAFVLGGALSGVVLSGFYYPALANQLSPKDVFSTFEHRCGGGEAIGLLGVGGRSAAYYTGGGQPVIFPDSTKAFEWLTASEHGTRRCLGTKAEDIPKLNSLFRQKNPGQGNLPVLNADSTQVVLVSSALEPGEKNQNSLEPIVIAAAPHPQHAYEGERTVNLEDKIQVLGFDIIDEAGKRVDSVAAGRNYRMRKYYKVLSAIGGDWDTFVHIDGDGRRHNADQRALVTKYPMNLWMPGDVIVDDTEFKLAPNFTPGSYSIFFGFYRGDDRLKVSSGPADKENRIQGGSLRVQ